MIEDGSKLYWDVRPSTHVETLEFRVADVCMSVDEAVMVAGLCRALAGVSTPELDAPRPGPPRAARAATWRASRFGLEAT